MSLREAENVISATDLVEKLKRDSFDAGNLIIANGDDLKIIPLRPNAKKLYLEVTTGCNFNCTTCIRHSWLDGTGQMEWATFNNLVEQLDDFKQLETVHFGGFGEPLTHPRALDMLETLAKKKLNLEMITNGSLLSEDIIRRLLALGMEKIYVSLDGPDDQEYNQIREGADFKQVYSNLKLLKQIKAERGLDKPVLNIEFVAMKSNYRRLPDLVRLLPDIGAEELLVTNVLPYHESMAEEILYDREESELFDLHQIWAMMRARIPQMKLRTERRCKFVEDKAMVVNWQGKVNPCYAMMHTYDCYIYGRKKTFYQHSFGNINTDRLKNIWTDPDYAYFRQQVKEFRFPSCTDCSAAGCSPDNHTDCWGNSLSCSDCLWSRGLIVCP